MYSFLKFVYVKFLKKILTNKSHILKKMHKKSVISDSIQRRFQKPFPNHSEIAKSIAFL